MASERVVLIDGSALVYRAYYAIPSSFATGAGLPTNATYGFALMFQKILAGKTPAFLAAVFDAPGKTFRDEKFPAYKAQRPSMPDDLRPQLEWIHKVVEAHDVPVLRVSGFEADDVIGTLTSQAVADGHEVWIISGDKDFAQLIGPRVRMIDTMRDITYDAELVRKKWGVPPEQFVDHLALMGDSSDNIPGVPGIGQKTSASLLSQYGSIDGILENLADQKGKRRENLEAERDNLSLYRELATIDCQVPLDVTLDDLVFAPPDIASVDALYKELEFFSLLSADAAETEEDVSTQANVSIASDPADIRAWFEARADAPIALYPVYEPDNPAHAVWTGLAAVGSRGGGLYVPIRAPEAALGDDAIEALRGVLESESIDKLTHDGRDFATVCLRHGVVLRGIVGDTALASFLVDPTKLIPHPLDQVARTYATRALTARKTLTGGGKSRTPLDELDVELLATWSCDQALAIRECWASLAPKLDDTDQRAVHDSLSLPTAYMLARMQHVGVRVDGDVLATLGEEFRERRSEVEAEVVQQAGKSFNLGSPKQLSEVLFEDLGLPVIKKTKTGYSTAADVLERLAPKHPIAADVLRWRSLDKLINTYTAVLRDAIHPDTGRVHCIFQQTSGASGRLITTDPDLQRTPIRTEDGKRIREAFIPRDGWVMISADWSQIELRLLAHFSEDPALVEAFTEGLDLHRRTAAELFDTTPGEVTADQRNVGKTVNFATIYGQGATSLGQQLGVSRSEAKAMIDRYFEVYAGVRAWLDDTIATAHETGFVTTLAGRRRIVHELTSNNFSQRAYGERIAANTPIQGSAADICKMAMLNIAAALEERQAEMLVQIHDELLLEAPPDEVDDVVGLVRAAMESVVDLCVPLTVDIGTGASWAEAH